MRQVCCQAAADSSGSRQADNQEFQVFLRRLRMLPPCTLHPIICSYLKHVEQQQ